jgi:hypothetical protein
VLVQDGLGTTLGMVNTGNGAVAVFNNSGLTINGVYLTPSSATTFGPNQTDQPLFSGQTLTMTGIAPGSYDLRVIFANRGFADRLGIGVSPGIITTVQVNLESMMRHNLPFLPILLLALSTPAFALPPDSPRHRIQILRSGNGQPRIRDAAASRVATPRTLDQTGGTRRSRPYQIAQPGEGEPKG